MRKDAKGKIKVLLADDHLVVRMGIASLLSFEEDIEVVGEVGNGLDGAGDFLANGEATAALISVCEQAKAEIVGCGIVIEKSYQQGRKRLEEKGIKVHSLARVARMTDDSIEFCEDA